MKILIKAVIALYVIGAGFVCWIALHAATITIPAYPAPPAIGAVQPGKGHQAEEMPQVLQPLWIVEPAVAAEVDRPVDPGEIYTVTGYCTCPICCGIWSADHPSRAGTDYQQLTASGTSPIAGQTCGADWSILPAGTVIEIENVGQRVVEDKGAAWISKRYSGRYIDLYFDSHEEAQAFGKQELEVWIQKASQK